MSLSSVDAVERSVHKTNEWLSELAAELGEDREDAWRMLRAYLQVLRDELTASEAAQLAAQLPLVLRGAFYDGYDPDRQPARLRHRDAFLALLAERAQLPGIEAAAPVAQAASKLLREHVTEGEWDDVLSQLPSDVREVLVES